MCAAPTGNQFWKQRAKDGRDKIFKKPENLWNACVEYFEYMDKNNKITLVPVGAKGLTVEIPTPRPYTLTGLYVFLDIAQTTWHNYKKNKDFMEVITRVENIMYTQKFEGAAVGDFNPNIIARDLGLSDKQQIEVNDIIVKRPNGGNKD